MTEIPEHLLKRSKAAKAGQSGGDAGGGDTPTASTGPTSAPVAAEKSAPVVAEPTANLPNLDPPPKPPKPVPAYVTAAMARKRVPVWVLPVLAALPLWAWSFAGTMQQPEVEDELLIEAAELYGSCSGCHGANGGGGVGYALTDGELLATFPSAVDQMVHVARGSADIDSQPYGSPDREGGQRVSGARGRGAMPAQLSSLNQLELELVVYHERAILAEEDTTSPGYEEWVEHMREEIELGVDEPIDLDFLLACADPTMTPGATGEGSEDPEEEPCPGPRAEEDVAEEAASS